jgi:hypothetical protein
MEMNSNNLRSKRGEEDLGVLGLVVNEADLCRINESILSAEVQARKQLHANMAANMIVGAETRGSYFVRHPDAY